MSTTNPDRPPGIRNDYFSPRAYQVELLDKAIKKNVVVQLGTGAGKTFIAVLLIKEYAVQLRLPLAENGRRAFFVVNTVALVEQQAEHIEVHTALQVGRMHGSLNDDVWMSKPKFDQYLQAHHVIVLTAQVLSDLIDAAYIKINNVALMILDECHHSLGSNHPYRKIMDKYFHEKKDMRPRILGLTASLINDKTDPDKLEQKLQKLERILDCDIETSCDIVSVSKYGARPKELVVKCKNYRWNMPYTMEAVRLLENVKEFVTSTCEFHQDMDVDVRKTIKEPLTRSIAVMKQLGPWAAWRDARLREREFKEVLMNMTLAGDKQKQFLFLAITTMNTIRRLLEPRMKFQKIETLLDVLPDKIVRLLNVLESFNPELQEKKKGKVEALCGIIFVEQRYIAACLKLVIQHAAKLDPSRFGFLRVQHVVGNNSTSFEAKASMDAHKALEKTLMSFRKGELNLLVATNVLEEGVDVKHCNLVVKLDRPTNFRSYIQSRGRARKQGSSYVVMVEEREAKQCAEDLRDFQKIEKLLLNRSKSVHNPAENDLSSIDDLCPPYVVEKTGAKLFLTSAIQLINKYCGKLPSDVFTRLVPQSTLKPTETEAGLMYSAELLLPMNSPLKTPICLEESEAVASKKLAQMMVAFKACKLLHEMGELNDHLLPVGKEAMLSLLDEDPDEFSPSYSARVGSMRRKQLYDKRTASVLHDALPQPDEESFLYILEIDLIVAYPPEETRSNLKMINPKTAEMCFGFLSKNKIPKIPAFPAFLRQGESRVKIVLSPKPFKLDEMTLTYLKLFHHYIFRSVLQLTKDSLEFQLDEATPISTLIVPLDRITLASGCLDYSIKMDYVMEVVTNMEEMPRVPTDDVRRGFKFEASEWQGGVVMPWYRNVAQPSFFYVIDILTEMSPKSSFPDEEFGSFNEYFKKKYSIEIYDQQQALLEVEYTSNRLNLLLPRHRPSRIRVRSSATPSQRQIFVPELLDRHPISARLWHSITALPSFFYRMNALLVADEIRTRVLVEAMGWSEERARTREDWTWNPLSYPTTAEERHSTMVTKLDQLRTEKESESGKKRRGPSSVASGQSVEKTFEIGVWDPALAAEFAPDTAAIKKVDGWLEDSIGLRQPSRGGDLSDDEDDEDASLHFDLSNMIRDNARLLAPRVDQIEETGWGDLPAEIEESPFMMIDGGPCSSQINLNNLMADLVSVVLPPSPPKPTNTSSSPSAASAAGAAAAAKKEKFVPKQLIDLWDAPMEEDDDREKGGKREEVVDLISFDDEPDEIPPREEEMEEEKEEKKTEDSYKTEISLLKDGEEKKNRRDREAIDVMVKREMKKGEVLASPLSNPRFSFHHPSQSVPVGGAFMSSGGGGEPDSAPYGVSPSLILAALTTSNANDGMNLERLETIGDSFLKYTVTDFLYHAHPDLHEGKLSFARSKEVSNCNLYRLGKKIGVPSIIIGSKFDAQDQWLPPCYVPAVNFKAPNTDDADEKDEMMERMLNGEEVSQEASPRTGWDAEEEGEGGYKDGVETITLTKPAPEPADEMSPLPYNLLTQQYISDKCIADSVEALIGAHLLSLGPQKTLQMMKWLGLKVMTEKLPMAPPLLHYVDTPRAPNRAEETLTEFFTKFNLAALEEKIGYRFNDKAYLLQAFTHASYYPNRITGCYQRLEFLGDAVLDYMITRFLYEHEKQYSPGVLTDLRSALVNNTIFASLAVKYDFHKHFVAMCPGLHFMIEKFVKLCKERNFLDANFHCEMYMVTTEDEIDEGQEEDVEVPKAMGDIFESVAGAIYLDCGGDLDVVWRVFYHLMRETIEECCRNPPRSPVRELLEREHDKAKFSKLERIVEKGKVRVTVEIGGGTSKMRFTGMGRNYRIAKSTAAKRALKYLKSLDEEKRRAQERKNRAN